MTIHLQPGELTQEEAWAILPPRGLPSPFTHSHHHFGNLAETSVCAPTNPRPTPREMRTHIHKHRRRTLGGHTDPPSSAVRCQS